MKILLKKGKQNELILRAKGTSTWKELSNKIKIKEDYLSNDIRTEKVLLKEEQYRLLCSMIGKNFDEFIISKLEDKWGKIKGGKNSTGNTKVIVKPDESIELAEFYGIMLGDGNLSKIKGYKIGVYQIRIVGDSRHDYKYLVNHVKPLIEKLFSVKVSIYKIPKENGLNLNAHGLKLVEFLEEKGFKPGDKIKNQLEIPSWIKRNRNFLKACLRGLFDTDGCVYKLTNQNSHQIAFTNYNLKLLNDVRESLISLGINPSKIMRQRDIVITKKEALRKFLKEVGFSNSKHLNKIEMWNI